jgi:S-adenosyl methyltransferase
MTRPGGVDTATPNVARIYDYLLGGKDNFAADREAGRQLIAAIPDVAEIARDNRSFVGRVVRYLVIEAGIRQFLDLGSGLPTQANVHELAQGVAPWARVVYVDNDPVVASHGQALLAAGDQVGMVPGDLRDPASILRHPGVLGLLDLSRSAGPLPGETTWLPHPCRLRSMAATFMPFAGERRRGA